MRVTQAPLRACVQQHVTAITSQLKHVEYTASSYNCMDLLAELITSNLTPNQTAALTSTVARGVISSESITSLCDIYSPAPHQCSASSKPQVLH